MGSKRFYLGVGMICAAIYNSRRTKDSQPLLSPEDFIPHFRESPAEIAARNKRTVDNFLAAFSPPPPSTPKRRVKE